MVPYMLTEEQKQTKVHWCHYMLEKFDRGKSNYVWDIISGDETCVYCFTLIALVTQSTVTSAWYTTESLPRVLAVVAERRPQTRIRGLLLHNDNAAAHRAAATKDFLKAERAQKLEYPPYSSDLAPLLISMRLFSFSLCQVEAPWNEIQYS